MPIAGERTTNTHGRQAVAGQRTIDIGKGYSKDPISAYAASFRDLAQNIVKECNVDIFTEPVKAALRPDSNEALRNFFIENSIDRNDVTPEEYDDHMLALGEQFTNDVEALTEHASVGEFNPVIGMALPMHKNILMNNIFDKGAIPKTVAVSPKFTLTMETRLMVDTQGNEIDMWKEQKKMKAAIDASAPFVNVDVALPEFGTTDVLEQMGASSMDSLSIETSISALKVTLAYKAGDKLPNGTTASADTNVDTWIDVDIEFTPNYGSFERAINKQITLPANTVGGTAEVINATMNKNRFTINALHQIVKAARIRARKDTSNGLLNTVSFKWKAKTDIIEIPEAIPMNVTISPTEVKDVAALYQVNQLSKIMSMLKLGMENFKDDTLLEKLNTSFLTMPQEQTISANFDFAPREGYALDHVEWRHKTFFDALDTYVTKLFRVLNNPNMVVTIFGRPDLIRKITPTEYTYQSPSAIGPVELDFTKTVVTSDKRVYQFISSMKLDSNIVNIDGVDTDLSDQLIIILCPRNTDRIIYQIYDYQLYLSNEIRNAANPTLPAIHAFERWKFVSYQPVQGRVKILNPTGLRSA